MTVEKERFSGYFGQNHVFGRGGKNGVVKGWVFGLKFYG